MIEECIRKGPMVLEAGVCDFCESEYWEFHSFKEVLTCGACGHRNASKAAKYHETIE